MNTKAPIRRPLRHWQFGLRTLIALSFLAAIGSAWVAAHLRMRAQTQQFADEYQAATVRLDYAEAKRISVAALELVPRDATWKSRRMEAEVLKALDQVECCFGDPIPRLPTEFNVSFLADLPPAAIAPITVPPGFEISLAASSPIVEHPIMAGFDDRGRLYVAENAGKNLKKDDLEKELPNSVVLLTDTDRDGVFDKRTVFADKLTFPQGALWHEGWLYVASSGAIWRFKDTNGDDVADVREQIVSKFGYTGNAADVHGCFLGPEGRIYWCEGRHGHEITDAAGELISKGKAARIFSCNPDGTDVQVHCGGGMDNPTEIDWTAAGEMLGTVNILLPKRGDCLVHWLHGGVYPRADQPAVLAEFKRTGELLGPVHDFGHVAVSGLCRYRPFTNANEGFGPEWNDAWFVTEFNTHKVKSVKLHREGSTFRAEVNDFFTSASGDSHPTDVLQDADGSLLVVDTGGWFRIGCPTSQIAKPEIPGAIYRIRKTGAKQAADAWGENIPWSRATAEELVEKLSDTRPAVRARAVAQLVRNKDAAVPYLAKALEDESALRRQLAAEALTKIGSPRAAEALRSALESEDPIVQQLAALGLGALRDSGSVDALAALLATRWPPEVQLAAATALGKIGEPGAIPDIFDALARQPDRSREHALTYALIEIDDPAQTRPALVHKSPLVRRAGLIALDQMTSGDLKREDVAALLTTNDLALQTAALEVLSRRPGWTDELVASVGQLLERPKLDEAQQQLVVSGLVAFAKQPAVQQLITARLDDEKTTTTAKLLLLEAIGQARLEPLPPAWQPLLAAAIQSGETSLAQAAVAAVSSAPRPFAEALRQVAGDEKRPAELRLAALSAASAGQPLASVEFQWLTTQLSETTPPALRIVAARALGGAQLTSEQQEKLTANLATAGPLEITGLLAAFEREGTESLGQQFAAALVRSPGAAALSLPQLEALVTHYPATTKTALQPMFDRLYAATAQQRAKLDALGSQLPVGNAAVGKQVFQNRQAGCFLCHRVGPEGGRVGPDLSTIGQRRNQRDLLEAVIFPSSSLARGYESQTLLLDDGRSLSGLITHETSDSIVLRLADQSETRVARASIEEMKPSSMSIMPGGLENTMSRQQLADLVAYLQSLK
jgi:putative membrane-bound dehydrogenase-like protein